MKSKASAESPNHQAPAPAGPASGLRDLQCPVCGRSYDAARWQTVCTSCDSPLLARYDFTTLRQRFKRSEIDDRPAGLWRWSELLPVASADERLSLGEGDTPMNHLPRLGRSLGLAELAVKDEGCNPTGSFKARGLAVAVARAAELKIPGLVIATAGNAGAALAAYAARHGLPARVFMPRDAASIYQSEVRSAGAELVLVPGLIDLAGKMAAEFARQSDWALLSTFREPYRVEGKKTMGFELARAYDWSLPDVVIYPTGGGTGLVGMWKAFSELEAMGWIGPARPRMICVQAEGCAPLVRALEEGTVRARPWQRARTAAHGLRVPAAYADRLILRVVQESGGCGLRVSDEAMAAAAAELARQEGVLACLEGAASLAGLRHLIKAGQVGAEDRIVLFNTGTGLKDL
jgi:threonine synthase